MRLWALILGLLLLINVAHAVLDRGTAVKRVRAAKEREKKQLPPVPPQIPLPRAEDLAANIDPPEVHSTSEKNEFVRSGKVYARQADRRKPKHALGRFAVNANEQLEGKSPQEEELKRKRRLRAMMPYAAMRVARDFEDHDVAMKKADRGRLALKEAKSRADAERSRDVPLSEVVVQRRAIDAADTMVKRARQFVVHEAVAATEAAEAALAREKEYPLKMAKEVERRATNIAAAEEAREGFDKADAVIPIDLERLLDSDGDADADGSKAEDAAVSAPPPRPPAPAPKKKTANTASGLVHVHEVLAGPFSPVHADSAMPAAETPRFEIPDRAYTLVFWLKAARPKSPPPVYRTWAALLRYENGKGGIYVANAGPVGSGEEESSHWDYNIRVDLSGGSLRLGPTSAECPVQIVLSVSGDAIRGYLNGEFVAQASSGGGFGGALVAAANNPASAFAVSNVSVLPAAVGAEFVRTAYDEFVRESTGCFGV